MFRSRLQGELLALLLADPNRTWTVDELSQRTGHPYQTVAAEVRRWQNIGVILVSLVGRTKLLRTNVDNPYVRPLTELVLMAFGPPLVVAEVFDSVTGVERLYIYGSWAARYKGESGPTPNDVDVLVVGHVNRDDVYEAAGRAQSRLGREVNTTIRTRYQWETATDGFTEQLRTAPILELTYSHECAEVEQGK
jgi:predicted nucleotidyltransferase